jgi:hypothetical protein
MRILRQATAMQRSRGDAENGAIASAGANYASGRAARTDAAVAVTADHNPERPTQMPEINDPNLTTRSPYQVSGAGRLMHASYSAIREKMR